MIMNQTREEDVHEFLAQTREDRLACIAPLSEGLHEPPDNGDAIKACVMEAVAYVAGERWSDQPYCACPIISTFLRTWNDALPDEDRDRLLRPLIPALIGTKSSMLGQKIERRRAAFAMDWLVREYTPAWLQLAGLASHADALASLPEITDLNQCHALMQVLEAAQRDAAIAKDAVASALTSALMIRNAESAWCTIMIQVKASAWGAARDAAIDEVTEKEWYTRGAVFVVREIVRKIVMGVAWTLIEAAIEDAELGWVKPTIEQLQLSAVQLVHRMIAIESA